MTETVPEYAAVTGGAEAKGPTPRETVWVVATAGSRRGVCLRLRTLGSRIA